MFLHHKWILLTREAGFEDLSASFKSLYKSLFGSMGSNTPPVSVPDRYYPLPQLPPQTSSNTMCSAVLGASVAGDSTIAGTRNGPQFTSLMDGLKNIAENNRWEVLSPSQIQGLRESFKSGNHRNFGMDQETFLEWSHSFDQFLSQLDNRIPVKLTGSGMSHSSFHLSNPLPPPPPYSQHTTATNSYSSTNSGMEPPFLTSINDPTHSHLLKPHPFKSAATDLLEEDEDEFDWSKLV